MRKYLKNRSTNVHKRAKFYPSENLWHKFDQMFSGQKASEKWVILTPPACVLKLNSVQECR